MLKERGNISKSTKLHVPVGQLQFVVFIYTKLLEKSFSFLFKIYLKKKHHSGSRLTEFWKFACAYCNLLSCSKFALLLHEIALVFSQSINLLHLLPIKTKVKDPEIYTFDIYFHFIKTKQR